MILAVEMANSADYLERLNWKVGLALLNCVGGIKGLRLPVALGCVFATRVPSSSQNWRGQD